MKWVAGNTKITKLRAGANQGQWLPPQEAIS